MTTAIPHPFRCLAHHSWHTSCPDCQHQHHPQPLPTHPLTCGFEVCDEGPHPDCIEFAPAQYFDCGRPATEVHIVTIRNVGPSLCEVQDAAGDWHEYAANEIEVSVTGYCEHHAALIRPTYEIHGGGDPYSELISVRINPTQRSTS